MGFFLTVIILLLYWGFMMFCHLLGIGFLLSVSRFLLLTGSQKWSVWGLAKLRWWKPQGEVKETYPKAAFDRIEMFPVGSRLLWEALELFPLACYIPFLPPIGLSLPCLIRLISGCTYKAKFRSCLFLGASGLWKPRWRYLELLFSGHSPFLQFSWEVWALSTSPEQIKLWIPLNSDINYKHELLRKLTRLSYLRIIYLEPNRHSGPTWILMLF